MRVIPVRNISKINRPSKDITQKSGNKISGKLTLDNFPTVAGAIGLLTPIPFAGIAFFGIGKALQVLTKKMLHKP